MHRAPGILAARLAVKRLPVLRHRPRTIQRQNDTPADLGQFQTTAAYGVVVV